MLASADQILACKPKFTDVPCPELGEGVCVRVQKPDAGRYISLVQQIKSDQDNAYAYWLVATCTNAEGQPLFTVEQAKGLAQVDYALVERLANAAMAMVSAQEKK